MPHIVRTVEKAAVRFCCGGVRSINLWPLAGGEAMAQGRSRKSSGKGGTTAKTSKKSSKAQAEAKKMPTKSMIRQMAKEWDHVT